MSFKNLLEDFAFTKEQSEEKENAYYAKIYENYTKDLETYGKDVEQIYSALLSKPLMESLKEKGEYLSELTLRKPNWNKMDYESPGDSIGAKMLGNKAFKYAKDGDKKDWFEKFSDNWKANSPDNKPGLPKLSDVENAPKGLLDKIKEFGSKIPAALKGFAEKGLSFFKENPWTGVLAAVAAAGLTVIAAKKIFKRAGRKLTPEQEAELKAKLTTKPNEESKKV